MADDLRNHNIQRTSLFAMELETTTSQQSSVVTHVLLLTSSGMEALAISHDYSFPTPPHHRPTHIPLQARSVQPCLSQQVLDPHHSPLCRKTPHLHPIHIEPDKSNTDLQIFALILTRSRLDAFVILQDANNRECHDSIGKGLAEASSWTWNAVSVCLLEKKGCSDVPALNGAYARPGFAVSHLSGLY